MHGEIRRGLFERSSTISEADGRLVGVLCQQDLSNVSLEKETVKYNKYLSLEAWDSPTFLFHMFLAWAIEETKKSGWYEKEMNIVLLDLLR